MHFSTHTIRRTATVAVIAAALAAIGAPVAQADRGFKGPDALDRALIVATVTTFPSGIRRTTSTSPLRIKYMPVEGSFARNTGSPAL